VLLDVGANLGTYSKLLRETFPQGRIYAFELNPNTFQELAQRMNGEKMACFPLGLGSRDGSELLYTYPDKLTSVHACQSRELMRDMHHCSDPKEIKCSITTLDKFCAQEGISQIDLLKVDTEGTEIEVLKGGSEMLTQNKIKMIQFEFGENDIFSRVFLRNFFELLSNYKFFRINRRTLIPLRQYDVSYEIFRYQNIVAVHRDFEFRY
jgi:FkbM family methyltransferase